MRVAFAGTPEFAAVALQAIIDAGHDVALVLTQPDRAAGRGLALQPSPVKRLAMTAAIDVFQPPTLRDADAQARLRAAAAEVLVVAAYGLILPQAVLDMPRFGGINIHASLLPRWRGAAPIQRALLAGDEVTGICVMQMAAGLDTGPLLLSDSLPIASDDTAASLHDKLAVLGARLIVDTLVRLPLPATPQAIVGITYAAKIEKAEARLDWRSTARQIERQVRAFNPFPGATLLLDDKPLKVWRADVLTAEVNGPPGMIVRADREGFVVACGEGALRLMELQRPGGKRISAAQFLAGNPIPPGTICQLPSS
ncbi:MAG TPA: methionyl-tRNA formyltransferase [Accumulibacter sp.]|jgi:methionyl-tRNA formyltransferase|nr:methionyl-tRNA formyltransferase [Accumulibacter sp.]HQC79526.1 methionyl-tRNA formyltransferase [Accumulibacter sp.]